MTLAATIIDWGAIGKVVLASLIAGVGVPALFALGVHGVTRSADRRRERRGGVAVVYASVAALAGVVVTGAVVYGIVLMTQK
jgi:hypothetical protein